MSDYEATDPTSLVATVWLEAGQRAPMPLMKGQASCQLPGCGLDGWVQLKTSRGPVVACFDHFQDVRDLVLEAAKPRKRPPSASAPV